MNHQLNTTDLQNFESKTQLAGQFGEKVNKALFLFTKIGTTKEVISFFIVEQDKESYISTYSLVEAVEVYNTL